MRYGLKPREKETMEKDTNDSTKEYGVRVVVIVVAVAVVIYANIPKRV